MIKRILLGFVALLTAIAAAIAVYTFSHIQEKPDISNVITEEACTANENNCLVATKWLEKIYKDYPIPSISAAVSVDGRLLYAGTVGFSDLDSLTPASMNSQYQIGSVSKVLTAVLAMRLHEQNIIDIEQSFQSYVSDFGEQLPAFTIKQLLSHQAGIRHYQDEFSESLNDISYPTTRDAASIVENDPLLFTPGDGFNYSTYGYSLVALALEQASGEDFETLMQNQVLSPINMLQTTLNTVTKTEAQATAYMLLGGYLFVAPQIDYSNKFAGAGYISTPSDLLKLGNALLSPNILNDESKALLFTPTALNNGDINPQNYALGLRHDSSELGSAIHHGGTIIGGYSFFVMYPEHNAVVAFSMNAVPTGFDREEKALELLAYFMDKQTLE